MLGEPFGNGSRHYHHRRGQRQAGLNYSCPASTIVCRQEARVPYLESGGVPPGWGLVGQEFEGGGVSVLAAQHGPLGQLQRWVEGWVLPAPFF
jgi:hypothetical protein